MCASIPRVSISDTSVARYNFDVHQPILIIFGIVLTVASLASLALLKFEDRCQFSNYQSERLLLCTTL